MKQAKRKQTKKRKTSETPLQKVRIDHDALSKTVAQNETALQKTRALLADLSKTAAQLCRELADRHDALRKTVAQIHDDLKHLQEALAQRGVWHHDYSKEHKAQ